MVDEMGSIAKFILDILTEFNVYYDTIPEGFERPCVYFPAPEIEQYAGGVGTYQRHYSWFIYFFERTTRAAWNTAFLIQYEIIKQHNMIPLICEDGSVEGHFLHIQSPDAKKVDEGAAQLYIQWDSVRLYDDKSEFAQRFEYNTQSK